MWTTDRASHDVGGSLIDVNGCVLGKARSECRKKYALDVDIDLPQRERIVTSAFGTVVDNMGSRVVPYTRPGGWMAAEQRLAATAERWLRRCRRRLLCLAVKGVIWLARG